MSTGATDKFPMVPFPGSELGQMTDNTCHLVVSSEPARVFSVLCSVPAYHHIYLHTLLLTLHFPQAGIFWFGVMQDDHYGQL